MTNHLRPEELNSHGAGFLDHDHTIESASNQLSLRTSKVETRQCRNRFGFAMLGSRRMLDWHARVVEFPIN